MILPTPPGEEYCPLKRKTEALNGEITHGRQSRGSNPSLPKDRSPWPRERKGLASGHKARDWGARISSGTTQGQVWAGSPRSCFPRQFPTAEIQGWLMEVTEALAQPSPTPSPAPGWPGGPIATGRTEEGLGRPPLPGPRLQAELTDPEPRDVAAPLFPSLPHPALLPPKVLVENSRPDGGFSSGVGAAWRVPEAEATQGERWAGAAPPPLPGTPRAPSRALVPGGPLRPWLLGTGGPARGAGSGRPGKQEMRQRRPLIGSPAFFSGDPGTRPALRGCLPRGGPPAAPPWGGPCFPVPWGWGLRTTGRPRGAPATRHSLLGLLERKGSALGGQDWAGVLGAGWRGKNRA